MVFRLISFLIIFGLGEVYSSGGDTCGQIKTDKIVSFPWNVGIYSENRNQLELTCFGTVIQPNAVITAAHCFSGNLEGNIRNTTFYIATDNLKENFSLKAQSTTLHKIKKSSIFVNKHYKGFINFFLNDLAIVRDKFQFNDKVKPACVDWSGDINDQNPDGKQAVWDRTKAAIVDQTYLNAEDCAYDAPKAFAPFITDDKFCTKTKSSGVTLKRESEGAGLFFLNPEDKRWYIKGVISSHEASAGQFSTYTSFNQYLNWISNICAGQ